MTFKTCGDFQTAELCAAPMCNWNSVAPKEAPLFTKEFCHPIKKADQKLEDAEWGTCLKQDNKDDCLNSNANVCAWNSGIDLIPDHDFCAPQFMIGDETQIKDCIKADTGATCVGQC